jgi:hypothetical protein
MLDENEFDELPTEAESAAPSPSDDFANRRERVVHEELERRVELFDNHQDSEFGEFTTKDWAFCTVVFFLLPIVIAWWCR